MLFVLLVVLVVPVLLSGCRSKKEVINRESEVRGYDFFGDDRTVDTHIKMLRGSLGPYRNFIVTLRGMGYKFEPDA